MATTKEPPKLGISMPSQGPLVVRKNSFSWWSRRSDSPPYEVVGPIERFDLRDSVASRAALVAGTETYEEYYARHPELEEADQRVQRYRRLYPTVEAQQRKRAAVYRREPLALALSFTDFIGRHLDHCPAGPIAERKVVLEPAVASRNIKALARYLGADLVGISELNPAWVYSHYSTRGGHGNSQWGEPIRLDHRYAITIAVAHDYDFQLASRGHSLSSTIETEQVLFTKGVAIAYRLASYIQNLGYPAMQHCEGGLVLAVPLAVDAGLGEEGRPGILITKKYGPAVRIANITTDLPLAVDRPVNLGIQDICTQCKKCAVVCPTKSISFGEKEVIRGVKHWPFDARGCIRLRQALGNTPCMYCMSACPFTKPRNIIHQTAAEVVVRLPISRRPLLWLDDFLYGKKPRLQRYPDWLRLDGDKPGLREKFSRFLLKI